jgi:hypothetical protein
VLYRVFPHVPGRESLDEGGPLFVPRERQGTGRHDNPDHYGALYVSRSAESAVAERIQAFRGQTIGDDDLARRDGSRYALVALDDAALADVVDLDDPAELVRRDLRPSGVATRRREVTRRMALAVYEEGVAGFAWWSTLEAAWTNVTLFAERAMEALAIAGEAEPLSVDHPAVRTAADLIGIHLST